MKILIVDDDTASGLFLASIIKEVPGVITDVAVSGKEALEKAAINEYQAAFLDIDMPDMDGLELAHVLVKKYEQLSLIFATAYPDHALEAFELYSVDYILKPYDEERIKKTVRKLANGSSLSHDEAALPVKTKEQTFFIRPSHILYIEARVSGNVIKTLSRAYSVKEDMRTCEARLQSYNFFRCHRSYLVNLAHVKEIIPSGRTYQIVLDTNDKLPLSRKYEKLLRAKLRQQ